MSRSLLVGTSVQGRPIRAVEIGNPDASRKIVVVGCIHGNEPAGIAIARALELQPGSASVDLWVINDLNPDGVAAGTRQNANGVDLNRNFPASWQPIGHRGDEYYSGPGPLSEPESRAAAALLQRLRPFTSIWFHQHENVIDLSGGDPAIERRFARTIGLPVKVLTRYPGSVATWENHSFPGTTAFVVELPAGSASGALTQRAVDAIRGLATPI